MAKIDHAAVRTTAYEDAQKFLKMYLKCICGEKLGEKPARKCWYKEGIQLLRSGNYQHRRAERLDHISIAVDSVEETMEKIKAYPATPINDHWFSFRTEPELS